MSHELKAEPSLCAEIALDFGIYDTYHYSLPAHLSGKARVGMRVLVPFGRRTLTGYIVGFSPPPADISLREVSELLDETPLFSERDLELYKFLSRYFFTPLGEVIKSALPSGINIESERRVKLTKKGEKVLKNGLDSTESSPLPPWIETLSQIPAGRWVKVSWLRKNLPNFRTSHLHQLIKEGLLELEEKLTRPRLSVNREKYFRARPLSSALLEVKLRRAPKQRELYKKLAEREYSLAQLRGEFGEGVTALLNQLKKKGLLEVREEVNFTDPFSTPLDELPPSPPPQQLTPAQTESLNQILPGLRRREFQPFLLYGVTGSGKTEIYLRIIEETLQLERQALLLVPEIALTPQLVNIFRRRLGDKIAVLHSGLTPRQRFDQWWRIHRGEFPVAIGARSAVFAPFPDLGAIIIDEEQESSYKQEGNFPYNARQVALMRGKINGATVILGSATPAFESFANVQNGKWKLLHLPNRVENRPLPHIEILDLRRLGLPPTLLSKPLEEAIRKTLQQGEQVILLFNRRGYYTSILCEECGHYLECPHCSVSLTYHRNTNRLTCHYCGYNSHVVMNCPRCNSPSLAHLGAGIEQLEEALVELFPTARIGRLDRDVVNGNVINLEKVLHKFRNKELDILLGTQMVAKGHDFPDVTLVGVVLADQGLNLPDFRSSEKSLQLLLQVAGRAGRGKLPGRVLIQTFNPRHPIFEFLKRHDYYGFYKFESEKRRQHTFPPFGWLLLLRMSSTSPEKLRQAAEMIGGEVKILLEKGEFREIEVFGPLPAPIERIKRRHRWQMLCKARSRSALHRFGLELQRGVLSRLPRAVKVLLDPDPLNIL